MSRLIFEGDTRERFGELFPKPFIEEIRVFDTTIETDVAVYFEVPEGITTAEGFLEETGMDQLRIYVGPILGDKFELAKDEQSVSNFIGASIQLDVFGKLHARSRTRDIDAGDSISSYELLDYVSSSEFFYNSNASKFIKFLITDVTEDTYQHYFPRAFDEKYIIAASFFPDSNIIEGTTSLDDSSNPELYTSLPDAGFGLGDGAKTSAISYHKIFNSDGSLNTGGQIVYLESDGNYYSNMPLRGLDRVYRKVNLITHQQAQDLIQATIQSSIEMIPEADLVSETLQKFSNDPNLLLEIQKNINNFSNKSSATAIGTLYGQLVDVVVEIDNILTRSEKVEKRLIFSLKLVDRRGQFGLTREQLSVSATQHLDSSSRTTHELGESSSTPEFFIKLPFFCRNLLKRYDANHHHSTFEAWFIENFMYLFFDYEKALNYKSEISNFFNPYNIQQIFGKKCLNSFFRIDRISVDKRRATTPRGADLGISTSQAKLYQPVVSTAVAPPTATSSRTTRHQSSYGFFTPDLSNNFANVRSSTTELMYSKLVERAFDTVEGLGDYMLKCYEISFLESAVQGIEADYRFYEFEIDIADTTMQFFEQHIYQKLKTLSDQLNEYLILAEQFCSYNNIDNKFNDFFNSNVREHFSEPFVWEEAPKYFYAIKSLIESSWVNSDTTGQRKKDGTLVDMDKVKELSIVKVSEINPRTGRLDLLRVFVEDFDNFTNSTIGYGAHLGHWVNRIWDVEGSPDSNDMNLKVPSKIVEFKRVPTPPDEIIDEIQFNPQADDTAMYDVKNNWSQGSTGKQVDMEELLTMLLTMEPLTFNRILRLESGRETQALTLEIFDFMENIFPVSHEGILADKGSDLWTRFMMDDGGDDESSPGNRVVERIQNVVDGPTLDALEEMYPYPDDFLQRLQPRSIDTRDSLRKFFQIVVPATESYNKMINEAGGRNAEKLTIKGFTQLIVNTYYQY